MEYSDFNWFSVITSEDSFNETLKYVLDLLLSRNALQETILVLDVVGKQELPMLLRDREVSGFENLEPMSQARLNPKFVALDEKLYGLLVETGVDFLGSPDLQDLSLICCGKYILETIFHHSSIFCFLNDEMKARIAESYKLQPVTT